jgi:hypothetical protein
MKNDYKNYDPTDGRTYESQEVREAKAYAEEAKKLVGRTVNGVCVSPDGYWGLVFAEQEGQTGEKLIAWVNRDPEGNGAGFLDIEQGRR